MLPPEWKPGGIGPVRVSQGTAFRRLNLFQGKAAYQFWQEHAMYFVSKPFTMKLPAGKWRPRGGARNRACAGGQGVYGDSGAGGAADGGADARLKPEHDELLLTWAKAEDVHVVNVLRMGDTKKPTSNRTLVTGQEDPRNDISEQGHTIALNINAPVGDTAKYYLFDSMFDGAHAQDGLVGYAHMAWAPVWYRRDAPELMPTWDPNDYYDFLKFGEPADGIVGVGSVVGRNAGSEFSVTAWFAALKQGRTFVSNGPMLLLTAGKAMPGDEVEPVAGEAIQVWTRAKRRSTMRCGPRRGRKRRCWGR